MEEQVLEEKRVFEESLEGFRERDGQPGLTLLCSIKLELLKEGTDFAPLVCVLLLWLLRADGVYTGVYLLEGAFEV